MSRPCQTCQHLKRAEIDRRLAVGEPAAQLAEAYGLAKSSLHRHRVNCVKLASSADLKKEAARGSAAVALLPSAEVLAGAYFEVREQIATIVQRAQQEGSLQIALAGLNSVRQTLDSLSRLGGHTGLRAAQVNVAVQTNVTVDARTIAERLIKHFDHQPEIKARIAQALLLEFGSQQGRSEK